MNPGDRLGPYEILQHIGAGGMGEVYRARDPRLSRDVAIKVLPPEVAEDADRLARFEREARLLAQLDHANIAGIFGIERQDRTTFLVMQLAAGETLASRLAAGPLSIDDTVAIARQIAEGVEAAHERGIVHRDLKPANVMVDADGSVKILDFGLAKALAGEREVGAATDLTASPTMMAGTAAGVILGTAAYMSPEQARGRPVDRRADIWAFGCLLYEMLVGRQPFGGDTVTDVLASIVKEQPDLSALPASTPPALRALLARCLEKEPRRRLRDIGEVRIALETDVDGSAFADFAAATGAPASSALSPRAGAAAAGLMLLTAVATWLLTRPAEVVVPMTRTTVLAAEGSVLFLTGDDGGPPTLSPDGTMTVFSASTPEHGLRLWLRRIAELTPEPLPGTEAGHFPFWSPDGRSIGFFAAGKLRRIDLATGQALTLAGPIEVGRGGAWHPDGTIYYVPNTEAGIWRVDAGGGEPTLVLALQPGVHSTFRWPHLLPDGEHLLFFAANHYDSSTDATRGVWIARRDGTGMRQLLENDSGGRYAAGHLLFVREGSLMAQPFDLGSLQLTGSATSLRDRVQVDDTTWNAVFSVSENGELAYLPAGQTSGEILRIVDRTGRELDTWDPTGNYQTLRFSPDNQRLAVEFQERPNSDLFVYDMQGNRQLISFANKDAAAPVWSMDGERLYHSRREGDRFEVAVLPSGGGNASSVFTADGSRDAWPLDYSAQARALLVGVGDYYQVYTAQSHLWVVPDDGEPYPLDIEGNWSVMDGDFSNDGRSLAYAARTRQDAAIELFVVSLLDDGSRLQIGESRRQVSSGGGSAPRWRGDDGEIFFIHGAGQITAVTIERSADGAVVRTGQPQQLFSSNIISGVGLGIGYDAASDGQRFVILESDPRSSRSFVLVSDWRQALER